MRLFKPESNIIVLLFLKITFSESTSRVVARLCVRRAGERDAASVFQVPMEYSHLQDLPVVALRNRLLLLHHVSELFCPCIPMFDLEGALDEAGLGPSVGFDTLRGILISQGKVRGAACAVGGTGVLLHFSPTRSPNRKCLGSSAFSELSWSSCCQPGPSRVLSTAVADRQVSSELEHVLALQVPRGLCPLPPALRLCGGAPPAAGG